MNLVTSVPTGRQAPSTDRVTWTRTRFQAALNYASTNDVSTDPATRNGIAVSAVMLWAWEVGWGAGEHNFNVGNVHCEPDFDGDCVAVTGSNGTENLRAYASLAAGVAEWFEVVETGYPTAWGLLLAGDLAYWARLQKDGYGGHVAAADAVSLWQYVAAQNGIAQLSADDITAETAAYNSIMAGGVDPEEDHTGDPTDGSSAGGGSGGGGVVPVVFAGVGIYYLGDALGWW